jgi:two-component system, LytTR family, response regulator
MLKRNIHVLIIDSDPETLKHTLALLETNPLISGVDFAEDTDHALIKILDSFPDIVLIEYPAKGKAGNEMIKFIKNKLPDTIIAFLSESKKNAVNAIRDGVFNYLLKPVLKEEIEKLVERAVLIKRNNIQTRINQIIENSTQETRLQFQTARGYIFIDTEDILFCKADGICTEIFLTKDRKEICYLFLSKVDTLLQAFNFLRVSRSFLINIKYIRKIFRASNTIILSAEGKEYPIKGSKQQIKILTKLSSE